jgi:MFS transporter, DHA1 family, multidrug resistance protein
MLWLSGPIWIAMLFLPETHPPTILLRRSQRLRALTGVSSLRSQSEIDQSHIRIRDTVIGSLWWPVEMMLLDPSIAFTAFYAALIYGIF